MERDQALALVVVIILLGALGAYFFLAPPPAPEEEQSWIVETIGEPEYLDPHKCYESGGGGVIQNVYETLYTYPFNSTSTVPSQPMLATALDISPDGLNYTFTLRQGVRFHDGTPFNASCVQYNMWRVMGRGWGEGWGPPWMIADWVDGALDIKHAVYEYGDGSAQHLGNWTAWVASGRGVEVIDTQTVRIILHTPYAPFLAVMAFFVGGQMSPTWAEAHGGMEPGADTSYVDSHMMGTGPYKFVEWVQGDKVVIERNEDYWRKDIALAEWANVGSLQKITFKLNEDTNNRILNLTAGVIDECPWPTNHSDQIWDPTSGRTPSWDGVGQSLDPNIKLWAGYPSYSVTLIGFNLHDTVTIPHSFEPSSRTILNPFYHKSFRECMSWAFDRDAFLQSAVNGWGRQMQGLIPHGMFGHVNDLPTYFYNLTAAVEKWNEALATTDLEARFANNSYSLVLYIDQRNTLREKACFQLKDGLTAVMNDPSATTLAQPLTIDIRTRWLHFGYIPLSSLTNWMFGWLADYADPDNYIGLLLKSTGTYGGRVLGLNDDPPGWNSTKVDGWIDEAARELDPDARKALYRQIEFEANSMVCYLYVYQPTTFITMTAKANGYWYNPMYGAPYYYYIWKE
jgi:peptide/nickel transport system substrate-binding protein